MEPANASTVHKKASVTSAAEPQQPATASPRPNLLMATASGDVLRDGSVR